MSYILHVDDSKTVRARVQSELGTARIIAIEKFVEIATLKEKPLLAILDLNMPSFTGEQISKFIMSSFGKIPIIIFSGESSERLTSAKNAIEAEIAISKQDPQAFEKLKMAVRRFI